MRKTILRIAASHGATNIRVFGSFVRGEQRKKSDLDLLVDLPADKSLLDIIALKLELEYALQRKVDVLTEEGISPYLRDKILGEAIPL